MPKPKRVLLFAIITGLIGIIIGTVVIANMILQL